MAFYTVSPGSSFRGFILDAWYYPRWHPDAEAVRAERSLGSGTKKWLMGAEMKNTRKTTNVPYGLAGGSCSMKQTRL